MIIQLFSFIFILLLMAAILIHPDVCVSGAASGLMIWFDSVLPSLFPFMVLTGLMIRMNLLNVLTNQLHRHPRFRHLSVASFFALVVGLLCGYPMGIKTINELKNTGQLSRKETFRLLAFVNQPGPMFVLGYALPLCQMTEKQNLRFLLALYGGIALTAVCSFAASALFSSQKASVRIQTANTENSSQVHQKNGSFLQLFEETILSSMVTLTKIGGYMMLFSLITALMKDIFPIHPGFLQLINGILEMTSGIAAITSSGHMYTPYYVLAFISFGGLCVTAQAFSLGDLNVNEQLTYLFWKILQSIFAVYLYYLINL